MHSLPATFPLRIGEEASQNLGIKIALALEITIKAAIRQARARHDLVNRHTLKAVSVKKLARAVNNVFFHSFAVTGRIGHSSNYSSGPEVCTRPHRLSIKILS